MIITNVMAVSLDGKIAAHHLESDAERRGYDFTNSEDQDHVQKLLTTADAVITGANSMRAAGAAWSVKNAQGRYPLWVVLSIHGLDKELEFWKQRTIPRWLVFPDAKSLANADAQYGIQAFAAECGVKLLHAGGFAVAPFVAEQLKTMNFASILLFGGGEINALFYEAQLVDKLKITISPYVFATPTAMPFIAAKLSKPSKLHLESSHVHGSHVFLDYKVIKDTN